MVLVGYENGGALQSKICPLDLWQFLPAQPVNTGTAPIKQPDVFCMTTPYSYDALFTWAFEVTPGDPGLGNRDIMFRNADFKAP
jgi:hypothetical protein